MKSFLLFLTLLVSATAFAPQFGIRETHTICFAKHVKDKAARWAKSKRPRKSRPSDINRKPIVYEIHSMIKPAEYSISDAPAAPMPKLAKVE